MLASPNAAPGVRRTPRPSRRPAAIAGAIAALSAAACTTDPGPTLPEAVPGIDARLAQPDGTLAAASARDWKVPDAAWDGRAPLEAAVALADQRFDATLRLAMLFWGLWLLPLGHLIVRSAQWPRVLGVLLLLGGTGYVVAVLGSVLSPAFSSSRVPGWLVLPATIGEFGTCLALLIRPPRDPRASSA